MAWNVLGQIALVRFGIAVTKQAFGAGNGNGNGDPGGTSDRKRASTPPTPPDSGQSRRSIVLPAMMPALCVFLAMVLTTVR